MSEKIYSKIEDGLLLHLITCQEDISGMTFLTPENEFLQLASLKLQKGYVFRPHKHLLKEGQQKVRTQEAWVVIEGSAKFIMYDIDNTVIAERILNRGDCSVTFRGGHSYEILTEDTMVYEFKTGPYSDVSIDKEYIDVKKEKDND